MATNPKPIIFKITEAGKQAALAASDSSPKVQIHLTQVAVGSSKYIPTGNETALKSEIIRRALVSGDVETASNTLRFSGAITSPTVISVYEVGLFTDTGVLFAVSASNSDALFTVHPDITFVAGFGLSLDDVSAENITVITDPNGALSIVMMENHLAAPNPHPQYLLAAKYTPFDSNLLNNYVLLTTYDAHILRYQELIDDYREHVTTNKQEHREIREWQNNHITDGHPHTQYLLRAEFDARIAELESRIRQTTGGSDGVQILALLALNVSATALQNGISGGEATFRVTEQEGLPITYTPQSLTISRDPSSESMHYFTFKLPDSYDSAIHNILATGGNSHAIDKENKMVRFLAVSIHSTYQHNTGGDSGYETRDRRTLNAAMRVEMTGKAAVPDPTTGQEAGVLNIVYNSKAFSDDLSENDNTYTLLQADGLTFTYPNVVTLDAPEANNPLSYDKDITINLPAEYDSAIHRLSISTDNGTYAINQEQRTITFKARVTSIKAADDSGIVTDTMSVTIKISIIKL